MPPPLPLAGRGIHLLVADEFGHQHSAGRIIAADAFPLMHALPQITTHHCHITLHTHTNPLPPHPLISLTTLT